MRTTGREELKSELKKEETMKQETKVSGPYFVVGTRIYKHWPESVNGVICDGEKQYGPDFVETYTAKKAAVRDAKKMNAEWAAKQTTAPAAAPAPKDLEAAAEDACSEAAYERHLDDKAAKDEDPRERGWL